MATAGTSSYSAVATACTSGQVDLTTSVASGEVDLTTAVISGDIDVAPRPQKKRILAQAFQDDPTFMSNET